MNSIIIAIVGTSIFYFGLDFVFYKMFKNKMDKHYREKFEPRYYIYNLVKTIDLFNESEELNTTFDKMLDEFILNKEKEKENNNTEYYNRLLEYTINFASKIKEVVPDDDKEELKNKLLIAKRLIKNTSNEKEVEMDLWFAIMEKYNIRKEER